MFGPETPGFPRFFVGAKVRWPFVILAPDQLGKRWSGIVIRPGGERNCHSGHLNQAMACSQRMCQMNCHSCRSENHASYPGGCADSCEDVKFSAKNFSHDLDNLYGMLEHVGAVKHLSDPFEVFALQMKFMYQMLKGYFFSFFTR